MGGATICQEFDTLKEAIQALADQESFNEAYNLFFAFAEISRMGVINNIAHIGRWCLL